MWNWIKKIFSPKKQEETKKELELQKKSLILQE
jgi:hypothetical protein